MAKLFMPIKSPNRIHSENELDLDNTFVERRFGRSTHYLIFDTETEEKHLVPNTNHHFGGADSPAGIAKNNRANTVLAAHMGYGPYVNFNQNNIPIYQVEDNVAISDLINQLREGKLEKMAPITKGTCCSGGKH